MIRFGVIADVHNGDVDSEPKSIVWDGDRRWFSNGPTRMANFASYMQTAGVDFCVQLGDVVDSDTSFNHAAELTEIVSAMGGFTGDKHHIIGNHEAYTWSVFIGNWASYTAQVSQTPPGLVGYWSEGRPAGWPDTTAYSFDKKGVHFVAICCSGYYSTEERAALATWLDDDLDATTLPIIILTHDHLDNSSGLGMARYSDYQTIQGIIESYNVQAVLAGHMHQVPRLASFITTIDEIPFYHLRANCIGPMDGTAMDCTNGKDAAFYLFEIAPNAVKGTSRMLANIKVTCLYTAREAANQTDTMNRDFTGYAIAGV